MNAIRLYLRRACFLTSCALATGLVAVAGAQTVLIDFGNNVDSYRGIDVPDPDQNGNFWNSMQPGTPAIDMVDVTGTATAIDLYFDTPVATDSYNGPAGPTDLPGVPMEDYMQFIDVDEEVLGNLAVPEAVFDYAASPGSTTVPNGNKTRFQLQGLNPAQTYTLTLFGSHSYSNNASTVYRVYSDSMYTNLVTSVELAVQDLMDPSLPNVNRVAVLEDLVPQTDDILYIEFIGSAGSLGYLNAFRIESEVVDMLVGDYNNNLVVDAADYTVWRDAVGTDITLPNDPVGGTIGDEQYANWKNNFGMVPNGGIGAGSVVPEPGSMLLFLLASVGIACWRTHRR